MAGPKPHDHAQENRPMPPRTQAKSVEKTRAHWAQSINIDPPLPGSVDEGAKEKRKSEGGVEAEGVNVGEVEGTAKEAGGKVKATAADETTLAGDDAAGDDGAQRAEEKSGEQEADVDENGLSKKTKASREAFRSAVERTKEIMVIACHRVGMAPPLDLEERAVKAVYRHTAFSTDLLYSGKIHAGFDPNTNAHRPLQRTYPKDMEDELHQQMLKDRIESKRDPESKGQLITGEEIWAEHDVWAQEQVDSGIDEDAKREAEEDAEDDRLEQQLGAGAKWALADLRLIDSRHYLWQWSGRDVLFPHEAEYQELLVRTRLAWEARIAGREKRDEQRLEARMNAEFGLEPYATHEAMFREDDNAPPALRSEHCKEQMDIYRNFFFSAIPPGDIPDDFHSTRIAYGAKAVSQLLMHLDAEDENVKIIDAKLPCSERVTYFVGRMNSVRKADHEAMTIPSSANEALDVQREDATEPDVSLWQGVKEAHDFFANDLALDPVNMACMAIFYNDGRFAAVTAGTENGLVDKNGKIHEDREYSPLYFGGEVLRLLKYAHVAKEQDVFAEAEIDPVQGIEDIAQVIAETGLRPVEPSDHPFEDQEASSAGATEHDTDAKGKTQQKNKKRTADEAGLDSDQIARAPKRTTKPAPSRSTSAEPENKRLKGLESKYGDPDAILALTAPLKAKEMQEATERAKQASNDSVQQDEDEPAYTAEELAELRRKRHEPWDDGELDDGPDIDDLALGHDASDEEIKAERRIKELRQMLALFGPAKSPLSQVAALDDSDIDSEAEHEPSGLIDTTGSKKGKGKGKKKLDAHEIRAQDADETENEPIAGPSTAAPLSTSTSARQPKPQTQQPAPKTATGSKSKKGDPRGTCQHCGLGYYLTRNNTVDDCKQGQRCADRAAKLAEKPVKARKGKKRAATEDGEDNIKETPQPKAKSKKRAASTIDDEISAPQKKKSKRMGEQQSDPAVSKSSFLGEKATPLTQDDTEALKQGPLSAVQQTRDLKEATTPLGSKDANRKLGQGVKRGRDEDGDGESDNKEEKPIKKPRTIAQPKTKTKKAPQPKEMVKEQPAKTLKRARDNDEDESEDGEEKSVKKPRNIAPIKGKKAPASSGSGVAASVTTAQRMAMPTLAEASPSSAAQESAVGGTRYGLDDDQEEVSEEE